MTDRKQFVKDLTASIKAENTNKVYRFLKEILAKREKP